MGARELQAARQHEEVCVLLVQAKKYAFKCHRQSEGGKDTVYPVNAMAFHPLYGTFATGGVFAHVEVRQHSAFPRHSLGLSQASVRIRVCKCVRHLDRLTAIRLDQWQAATEL